MGIRSLERYAVTRLYWAHRMQFVGRHSVLYRPLLGARIEAVCRPGPPTPCLRIGDHVNIEQGVHIICQANVTIEDYVSITPYCVIVDTSRPFDDPDRLPKIGARLNARTDTFVRIGQGSFIGAHSVILPNVDIGRGCVIGAGSVVTRSVPDYCVAQGAPARVVRRFNTETRLWGALSQ